MPIGDAYSYNMITSDYNYSVWDEATTSNCTTSYTYTGGTTCYFPYTYYRVNELGLWEQIAQPVVVPEPAQQAPLVTEEQCAQWIQEQQTRAIERNAEINRQQAEVKAARDAATERGNQLLKDVLGEADHTFFKANGYVDIPSRKDVNMRYRIRAGRRIGIVKREGGGWSEKPLSLCIHPESHWQYVVGDLVASHALLAKFDEATLDKVANVHKLAA